MPKAQYAWSPRRPAQLQFDPDRGVVRVSGPFTVEAVQPPELSLGDAIGMFDGAPGMIEETFQVRPVESFAETKNVTSYLDQMIRLMRMDGVRFPDNNGKDGLIDPDKFEAFSGTTSLPFKPGKHNRVAVKVIDPRGNEVMQVHELK